MLAKKSLLLIKITKPTFIANKFPGVIIKVHVCLNFAKIRETVPLTRPSSDI